ncbi:bifunctional lysylphosphatidylglycerol flippase/synthetase MprF [Faecalimicrobium sp. JNUCC 81]
MKKINSKKTLLYLKIAFVVAILFIVFKEFKNIVTDFNMDTFVMYADKLSIVNILIIIALGMISFLPLSFYDFVLKKRVGINLDNKRLYKFSFIASSVSSIVGFGGTSALALKSYFYKDHVKDNKLLVKEISKVVALNLSGFSMICFLYVISNLLEFKELSLVKVLTMLIGCYLPVLSIYLIRSYIKGNDDDKIDVIDSFKIIGISLSEWVTTIILIYSIILILGEPIPFMKFFPIFVAAIVVAILSMSPGGVGTFDLTLLVGLEGLGVSSEKVLLAVFLYRISYYIIPVSIGAVLYLSELWNKVDGRIRSIVSESLSTVAHFGLRLLVLSSGVVLLVSEAMPSTIERIHIINKIFNFKIMHMSGDIAIIIGFLLITISSLITYKSKKVYNITMVLVLLGSIFALIKGFDYEETLYLITVGVILKCSKRQFYREGFILRWGKVIKDTLALLFFQAFYLFIAYANISGKIKKIPLLNIDIQHASPRVYKMIMISITGFVISLIFMGILYYTNKSKNFPKLTLGECEDKLDYILDTYNGAQLTHYIYLNDKYIYVNDSTDVLIQYQIYANKVVVLGNPIGNKESFFETIQTFYELCDRYGYTPVFCSIDETMIPYLHETGYEFMKLGEDAGVDLNKFTLEGRKMKSVRNALSRVEKEGYTFDIIYPPFSEEFIKDIKSISDEWLGDRKEKGFSVGFFDEEYLNREPIAIIKDKDNNIQGFANLMPMYDNRTTLSIDLMRFSESTCNGVMDFIFVNLFQWGRENGYSKFNMGLAPLSNVGVSKYSFLSEKIAAQVYAHGQRFYSFQGLKKFKEKYCDSWDGRYMAYKRKTSLVFTMIQVILLFGKGKDNQQENKINDNKYARINQSI